MGVGGWSGVYWSGKLFVARPEVEIEWNRLRMTVPKHGIARCLVERIGQEIGHCHRTARGRFQHQVQVNESDAGGGVRDSRDILGIGIFGSVFRFLSVVPMA